MTDRRSAPTIAAFVIVVLVLTVILAPRFLPGLLRRPVRREAKVVGELKQLAWTNVRGAFAESLDSAPVLLVEWCDTDPRAAEALARADAWRRLYAPFGIRVVAVHEPEFAFAADTAVAAPIARRWAGALPVAFDPGGRVENALGGAPDGPRVTLADVTGDVLSSSVDDGAAVEPALRALAASRAPSLALPPPLAAPGRRLVRTVPTGVGRVARGPLHDAEPGRVRVFVAPLRHEESSGRESPTPVGAWRPGADGITAARGGAANFITLRYSAARVGAVLGPPPDGPARVWILRDDRWPDGAALDEDAHGGGDGAWVDVTTPRLYWLEKGRGERTLKLSPDRPGVTVHAFVLEDAPH